MASELEDMHKSALELIREQIKKHSLGKLVFLAFTGTRPWGIAQENVDYDYRGIYMSRGREISSNFISEVYMNNHAKDITMVSLEHFIGVLSYLNIHSLITLNSPIIYASKEFSELRDWINSNFCKIIYGGCQTKTSHANRKDYLYDFFFMGNGISILEKKKVIANLPELNKKVLKIPAINKIIEEEKANLPFKTKQICEKALRRLRARLERANKKSRLPKKINQEEFNKLRIVERITQNYGCRFGKN